MGKKDSIITSSSSIKKYQQKCDTHGTQKLINSKFRYRIPFDRHDVTLLDSVLNYSLPAFQKDKSNEINAPPVKMRLTSINLCMPSPIGIIKTTKYGPAWIHKSIPG